MIEELLPCPHCGGPARLSQACQQVDEDIDISLNPEMQIIWIVECAAPCRVYVDTQDEAIIAWNSRADAVADDDLRNMSRIEDGWQ